jgi:hypothetical protein
LRRDIRDDMDIDGAGVAAGGVRSETQKKIMTNIVRYTIIKTMLLNLVLTAWPLSCVTLVYGRLCTIGLLGCKQL